MLFNLGHSDLRCAGIDFNNTPPPDPAKYAVVAQHVARHYNDGWAHGYHLGIRYWEIWNEPDLVPFWTGTREQYYALYCRDVARAQAAAPLDAGRRTRADDQQRPHGLPRVAAGVHRAQPPPARLLVLPPLHGLRQRSAELRGLAGKSAALLDNAGFRHTAIQLTEWNYALTEPATQMQRAAFAASSLALMQDAPISRAVYHRADAEGGPDWQLVNDDGSLSKTGHAFEAVGKLARTPLRLRTRGGDDQGFSVLAGRSLRGTVRVLLTNYEIPPEDQGPLPFPDNIFSIPGIATFTLLDRRTVTYTDNAGYDLTVKGLHGRYVVRRYRVDAGHDLTLVDSSVQHGDRVRLSATLPAPAVELVEIAHD